MDSSVSIQSIPPVDQQKHPQGTSNSSSATSSSSSSSSSASASTSSSSSSPTKSPTITVPAVSSNENSVNDSQHQCPICLEEISSRSIINPCFHEFCRVCVFEWIRIKNVCPVCRQTAVKILYNINSDLNYDEFLVPAATASESSNTSPEGSYAFIYTQANSWVNHLLANVSPIYVTRSLNSIEQRLKDYTAINFQAFYSFYQPSAAITNSSDPLEALKAFRCYVYRYNLRSVKNNSGSARLATVVFYRQNPALVSRLVDMLRFDIESLQKLQHVTYSPNLLSEFHQLLFLHNIDSANFKNDFKRMFAQYCNLANSSLNPVETLYHEISSFAKSKHSTIQEYAKNVMYARMVTRRDHSSQLTQATTSSSNNNSNNINNSSSSNIVSVSINSVPSNNNNNNIETPTSSTTINNNDLLPSSSNANNNNQSSGATVTITAIPALVSAAAASFYPNNNNGDDIEIITLESTSSDSDIQVINNQTKQQQAAGNSLLELNSKPGPSGINSFKNILSSSKSFSSASAAAAGGSRGKKPMKRPLTSSTASVIPSPSKRPKIAPAYTRKEIMEMRRIIRNAQHSEYFFRKLLREIKKKFYDYDTILNSEHFAYLNQFFRDVFTNSKLFRTKLASLETSKRALSFERIKRLLSCADSDAKSSKTQTQVNSSRSNDVSSTDSDELSATTLNLEQYEQNNRSTINEQIMKHAMSPPQSSAQSYLMFAKGKIKFNNRIYSDSDLD